MCGGRGLRWFRVLNSHTPDECCGRLIGEALRSGKLDDAILWPCPKCGMEWRPLETRSDTPTFTQHSKGDLFREITYAVAFRHWQPHPHYAVVPVRP